LIRIEVAMSYHVTHRTGEMEPGYPLHRFGDLLDELSSTDNEHLDVAVTHESEWSLTVYRPNMLVFENLEHGEPAHLGPVDRDTALEIMVEVAQGRIEHVRSRPWQRGNPPRHGG
jgi:hypothetical protein